jgi:tetratricopeptide (TPR) repeat protein
MKRGLGDKAAAGTGPSQGGPRGKGVGAQTVAAHCDRGEKLLNGGGQYRAALQAFTAALALDGRSVRALRGQGGAYYFLHERHKALAALNKAVALAPKDADTVMDRGYVYKLTGDVRRGIVDFSRAIALDPKNGSRYDDRGRAYYAIDEYEKSIADLTQAIRLSGDSSALRIARGRAYYASNARAEAINDYTRAIALSPKDPEAYILRGRVNLINRREDRPLALADADRAISLNAKLPEAYRLRADYHYEQSQYPPAIADYTRAVALNAGDAESLHGRGLCLEDTGKTDAAIADFTAALAIDPKRGWSYSSRARNLASKGELKRALEDLNKAVALEPDSEKFWDERGVVLWRLGGADNKRRALLDFDHEVALWGRFGGQDAFFHRGICRIEQGKADEALEDLTKCIMRAPGYRDAYRARSGVFFARGDVRRAIMDMDWVIDKLPASPTVRAEDYRDRAVYRAAGGDTKGANGDYAEARRRKPELSPHAFAALPKGRPACPACHGIGFVRRPASLAGAAGITTGAFHRCERCKAK